MKDSILVILLFFVSVLGVSAQTTIEECYSLAHENYPLVKKYSLIEQSKNYSLQNARSAYYPQLSISAKATYQTDVIEIPFKFPGIELDKLPNDQYQVAVELDQTIWDGGVTRSEKRMIQASSQVDLEGHKVEMYALNERVDGLYFGVLMLDEQLIQSDLLDQELDRNLAKVKNYVVAGIANSADVDVIRVEILMSKQRRAQITATRGAYLRMLSLLVGRELSDLVRPSLPRVDRGVNNRPELDWLDSQIALAQIQKSRVRAKNLPRFGAFVQGAYGNPGLNMLKAGFTPYAIGGVRMSWNFGGYYTQRNDLRKSDIQAQTVENQKEVFLFNTRLATEQTWAEIERLRAQMMDDDRIIELRGNIKRSAEVKVAMGTMSVTDMLAELTAQNSAIINKKMHEVELLKTLYILKNQINN